MVKTIWPFLLTIAFFGAVIIASIYVLIVLPDPHGERCDRLFAEFMASNDAAIINRDGWLLYELDCNVGRRYRKLHP